MNHYEVAAILREIAALIELSDPLPQKAIAYRKAAIALESIQNMSEYAEKLETLPGIGPKIAEMILTLYFVIVSVHRRFNLEKKND